MVNMIVDFSFSVMHPFGMRKKLVYPIIFVLVFVPAVCVFYFTRPLVAFVCPDAGKEYLSRLDKPAPICLDYRTVVVKAGEDVDFDKFNLIINHSEIGIQGKNIYNVDYDPASLFCPIIDEYQQENLILLYDLQDDVECSFAEYLGKEYPGIRHISYNGSMDNVDYAVNGSKIETGDVLIVLDASAVAGFLRYLDSPRFIVDYIDAAGLDGLEAEKIAFVDWDYVIRSNLKTVQEGA